MVYLFQPTPANLAAYHAAVKATDSGQAGVPGGHELAGHHEQRDRRRGARPSAAIIAGLNQMPTLRGAVTNRAVSPLQALGGVQRGHPERTQAVPGRGRQPDQRHRGGPGPRADRHGVGQGGAVAGVRAAVRGAGREQDDPGRPRGLRRDGRDPAGRPGGRGVPAGSGRPGAVQRAGRTTPSRRSSPTIEGAVAAGTPVAKLPVTLDQWQGLAGSLLDEYFTGGVNLANAQLAADHTISRSAWVQGRGHRRHRPGRAARHHRGDHRWSGGASSAAWAAWSARPCSSPRFSCPTSWPG